MFKESISFIRKVFNKPQGFIALHEPNFSGNEKKYVLDTIDSTFVSSVGAYVDKAESMMAELTQTKKAVAVVNGTSALQIGLQLVGVGQNDEVITQALTFVATANAIHYTGAEPIFLDVDIDTMGLSPKSIEQFLNQNAVIKNNVCFNKKTNKKIAACVPMHTFGFPCRIAEIIAICDKWRVPVVEDAAESLGSSYNNQPTGSYGKMGIFSFNGNKIVTCGGGGMIVTNDELLGSKGKHLTTTAKVPHPYEYAHDEIGYNFRMPNLNAALVCAQLEQLPNFLNNKRELAKMYSSHFTSLGIKFRNELPNTQANYWLMCIELENKQQRDLFLQETNESGIMTRPIWQLMFRLPMYAHCYKDDQTNAIYLEERIVNIPSSFRN